jgi:hypothetical protein
MKIKTPLDVILATSMIDKANPIYSGVEAKGGANLPSLEVTHTREAQAWGLRSRKNCDIITQLT